MPSCPPAPIDYRQTPFDHEQRPMVTAALLSGYENRGIIEPTDCVRWMQRDLNELCSRGWAQPHRMRCDRLWIYRLTEIGHYVAESLRDDGVEFDGWDAWEGERLLRRAA